MSGGMDDSIDVRFDAGRGELTLTCYGEAFARVRDAIITAAGVAEIIEGELSGVRRIEVEVWPTARPAARQRG